MAEVIGVAGVTLFMSLVLQKEARSTFQVLEVAIREYLFLEGTVLVSRKPCKDC